MSRAVSIPMSDYFTGLHREHGVDLRLGTGVVRVLKRNGRTETADHLRAATRSPKAGYARPVPLRPAGARPDCAGWEDDEHIAAALNSTTEDVAETARRGMRLLARTGGAAPRRRPSPAR
jgi:NADPH-dependent 2,4-dienoyl-CoA reductase/sulfur reductase-like enzyme